MTDVSERSLSTAGNGAPSCQVFRQGRPSQRQHNLADISEILDEPDTLVWFDVVNPGPHSLAVLQEEFDLHPLAVEDATQEHERPKIEAYSDYWFLVVQGITIEDQLPVFHEIAIFAGRKFLVTVRHNPPYPLLEIEHRWDAHPDRLRHGGGFLLYTILDTIVDGYLPVAELFQDRVAALEAPLFEDMPLHSDLLPDIFQLKKAGQAFRRAVVPMRDILNPIIRGDLTLFPEEEIIYFRDIYDHAVRVIDEIDTIRDLLSSLLEIHLSVVANRQNSVAQQLTIVATVFLPLSFLVGFFGQNFSFLVSHIAGTGAFWGLGIGSEVVAIVLLFSFFKQKGWF